MMTKHSSYCGNHTYRKGGQDIVKPVQRMVINGEVVCPRCELEKEQKKLLDQEQERFDEIQKQKKYDVFYRQSIISDDTILSATLENYTCECAEETENKEVVQEVAKRLQAGEIFNTVFQGKQGTGKSHLAYGLLRELNEHDRGADPNDKKTCLFVSVEEMVRLIKDSFNNKESKYTEQYFVQLMSEVDFLVLDDLGAETGAIETDKAATNFVQRILYAITTARQSKATILTTNLSSKTMFGMYDSKLVSRLLRNPKFIIFKDAKDKRITKLPF